MDKLTLGAAAMEAAARIARFQFRKHPDVETLVCDSQSLAWEAAQTAPPAATPGTVAQYAVQQAKIGRQFQESVRSINHLRPRGKTPKPERVPFDPSACFSERYNPARVVAFRLDFRAWLESLNDRQRAITLALAVGEETFQVADAFGCTPSAISQFRDRLAKSWHKFQAG